MKNLLVTIFVSTLFLTGCGSDEKFVKEVTERMVAKLAGFDESIIESCIEDKSDDLSDADKKIILGTLDNPGVPLTFTDMGEMQKALKVTTSFSQKIFNCIDSNK